MFRSMTWENSLATLSCVIACPLKTIICDHEFTTYLTDVVSMVDLDTEPAAFIASYNGYRDAHGAGTAAGGTSGVYQGAVEEELPECSATEDLYPGVGCEGRRRSRINGY